MWEYEKPCGYRIRWLPGASLSPTFPDMGIHQVSQNIFTKLTAQGHSVEWLSEQTGIDVSTLSSELRDNALTVYDFALIMLALQTSPSQIEGEETMTAQELAASELRCSVQQVYRMARDGDIPAVRVGRSWRFVVSEVRAALAHTPVDLWAPRSRKKLRIA